MILQRAYAQIPQRALAGLTGRDKFLGNLAFLAVISCWIPFVPFGPETQPILGGAFLALCLIWGVTRNDSWRKSAPGWAYLTLPLSLLPAFLLGVLDDPAEAIASLFRYVFPIAVFAALVGKKIPLPSKNVIRAVVWVHIGMLLVYLVGQGDLFASIYSRARYRVAFLSYEPSYAATYLFVVGLACIFSFQARRDKIFYLGATVACILATQSLLGLIYVTLLVLFSSRRGLLFMALSVPLLAAIVYFAPDDGRIGHMRRAASAIATSDDVILGLVVLEPSGTTRALVNSISIDAGVSTAIGYGIGSFSDRFGDVISRKENRLLDGHLMLNDLYAYGRNAGRASPQSYLASLAFEAGMVGVAGVALFLWVAVVRRFKLRRDVYSLGCITYVLLFLFFQSQVSNPLYWYVFYLLIANREEADRRLQ